MTDDDPITLPEDWTSPQPLHEAASDRTLALVDALLRRMHDEAHGDPEMLLDLSATVQNLANAADTLRDIGE